MHTHAAVLMAEVIVMIYFGDGEASLFEMSGFNDSRI
jgi:hypothetical protein